MKKILIATATIVLLSACSDEQEHTGKKIAPAKESIVQEIAQPSSETEEIGVTAEGKEAVQLTIPKAAFEGMTDEEVEEVLLEQGAQKITFHQTDAISYIVPKEHYQMEKKVLQQQLQQLIEEINEPKNFTTIKKIEVNTTYTNYQVYVDQESYEASYDSTALLSLMMSATYYLAYIGDTTSIITVNYVDEQSKNVYKTETYPEQ